MSQIRVLTESELLHRHGLTASPGYYVTEEFDRVPASAGSASHEPVPNILDGPFPCESLATHVAETRYGMETH